MFFHILLFISGFLLFFQGLYMFRSNLRLMSNDRLSRVLSKTTTTPWKGAIFGTFITALFQSSSAVMVVTIGLVDAGLLTFPQVIGIILGTNVGTCITVQMLAFNFNDLSMPFIFVGVLMFCLGKRNLAAVFSGFGLIFLGLSLITNASAPLLHSNWFKSLVSWGENEPLKGIVAGAIATAVIQHSSIVIGVIIALSRHNTIPLTAAVPLVLGSNLGTCFTGILVSIGASRSAQQVAVAHVMLNLLGIVGFTSFLDLFISFVSQTAVTPAMQIANAHTLFNLLSSLIVLPFAGPFSNLVRLILPERP